MALKIKLFRVGKRNDPKYRIVVSEEHNKREGKYIDNLGHYDPIAQPHVLKVDTDRLKEWIAKGAQFTDGTYKLLAKTIK